MNNTGYPRLVPFMVNTWLLSYLIEGDEDIHPDDDLRAVDDFEVMCSREYGPGHFSTGDGTTNFTTCDITGTHGLCELVHYVAMKPPVDLGEKP